MAECRKCGIDHEMPPLYDIEQARRELRKARRNRDELTRQQAQLGENLAHHIDRHFTAEEMETVGRALLIAAGGLGALVVEDMPPAVMVNVLGFAGDRLITDGRIEVPNG